MANRPSGNSRPSSRPPSSGASSRMLSVRDVAEMLGVSPDTVYDEWRKWGLKGYRIGKHLRFREREVDQWIEKQAA
jgi:excisionase family DNA binding protein